MAHQLMACGKILKKSMAFQSEKNQFEKVDGRVFLSSNVHYEEQQCKHDSEYHEFKAIKEKKLLV